MSQNGFKGFQVGMPEVGALWRAPLGVGLAEGVRLGPGFERLARFPDRVRRVKQADWLAELVRDAGGHSPWANPGGVAPNRTVTTEQILAVADEIDAFVTATVALSEPGSIGVLEGSPAMQRGRLFDVHRRSRPEHNAYD